MSDKINKLVSKILIVQQNDYRVSDIIFKKGLRWEYSANGVLTNQKYNGSILKSYLEINGLYSDVNLKTLLDITQEYTKKKNFPIPGDNEIVLHLRLGDFVDFIGILIKPYIKLIREYKHNKPNIDKITIITAYSYGTWSEKSLHLKTKQMPMWECTDRTQNINKEKITNLIEGIHKNFPRLKINIISSLNIDKDFCYCVNSKHFINDNGGFSDLMMKLNNLRKNELQNQEL
jgi:hypothetical protein